MAKVEIDSHGAILWSLFVTTLSLFHVWRRLARRREATLVTTRITTGHATRHITSVGLFYSITGALVIL